MPRPLSVYLVRHGESAANLNKSLNTTMADHMIPLSQDGMSQAEGAGRALSALLAPAHAAGERIAAYVSPYLRTRQTWQGMLGGLRAALGESFTPMTFESMFLREIEFGLFDGIADEDLEAAFPLEYRHYEKMKSAGGEYYARMPMGESRCDVAQRVHQCFGKIHRDHDRHGVTHAIIVSHGVTTRAFVQMWLDLPPEWMEAERNPLNCSIRLLRDGRDHGYVHNGRPGHNPARERREDGRIE